MQTTADVYSLEPSGVEMCVCKTQGGEGDKKGTLSAVYTRGEGVLTR